MAFTHALTYIDKFQSEMTAVENWTGQSTNADVFRFKCVSLARSSCPRQVRSRNLSPESVSDRLDQDARNAIWSGPSSTENNTRIISFVLTLPLMSLLTTTRC